MFYFFKTPFFIQKLFPKYLWRMPKNKKAIYLTFDDGPTPEITEWTLAILKEYNAKATFFCEGKNVAKYPKIVKNILLSGHSVGNHTYSHLNGWFTKSSKYIQDVEKAQEVLEETTSGKVSLLFRPPYGKIKPIQANALLKKGYKIVMIDVVCGDFDQQLNAEKCLERLLKNTKQGSIVVFHDSKKSYKILEQVLPKVLENWDIQGFEFLPLK